MVIDQLINLYQRTLSPVTELLGHQCRFHPTCSEYMRLSIKKYGYLVGTCKGILRILRCNPLFKGGFDYP